MKTEEELNKEASERTAMLKKLSFRLKLINEFNLEECAYKRRGVELTHIPHSSVKVAKDFDDTI